MDARLQKRVQRYGWDRAASLYERYWAEQLLPAQNLLLERADLRAGERVLDVACGTGLITFRAADAVGPGGLVTATDISEKMVAVVRERAAVEGISNVVVAREEAESVQQPGGSFDVVLCALGLMYVTDPLHTLREFARVLRPGGRVVAAVWGAGDRCGWAEVFPIVERRVETDVCPLFFRLGTGSSLRLTMEMAGMSRVDVERISTVLRYRSEEDACGAAFAGGPVALAWSRFDDDTRESAYAEYLESIAPYERAGSYEIPGEFVVASGYSASEAA